MSPVPADLLEIASTLLPGVAVDGARLARGQFHDVVLVPPVAAVRIARRPAAAAELPRRTALLRALSHLTLPFEIPHPLGDAVEIEGRTAAAVSWCPGRPVDRHNTVDAARIGILLEALRSVPLDALLPLLGAPHALAGGHCWQDLAVREAVPLLPPGAREEALRRIAAAAALAPVSPVLVHGDLGGDNVHWSAEGAVIGVLDWDLAQPFDQAVDVACLANSYGWNAVSTVDADTHARAHIWAQLFPVHQLLAAVRNDEPPAILDQFVLGVSRALDDSGR